MNAMDDQTIAALKRSIDKWQDIVDGSGIDRGIENCSLCDYFFKEDCDGCPVYEKTGRIECDGTPYRDQWSPISDHIRTRRGDNGMRFGYIHTEQSLAAAKAELEFLKSLLPPDSEACGDRSEFTQPLPKP